MTRGRFAPSPTGRMHLGNVFCALLSWLSAKSKGGEWVLRIEDLDPQRSRREYALQLMDDLQWLGLPWDGEPVWQSQRGHIYEEYLHRLTEMGLTYPCYCTRADIMATQAPHETDGRVVYKGTCRPKYTDAARSVPTATSFNVQHSPFNASFSPPETGGRAKRRGWINRSPLTAHRYPCHHPPHRPRLHNALHRWALWSARHQPCRALRRLYNKEKRWCLGIPTSSSRGRCPYGRHGNRPWPRPAPVLSTADTPHKPVDSEYR